MPARKRPQKPARGPIVAPRPLKLDEILGYNVRSEIERARDTLAHLARRCADHGRDLAEALDEADADGLGIGWSPCATDLGFAAARIAEANAVLEAWTTVAHALNFCAPVGPAAGERVFVLMRNGQPVGVVHDDPQAASLALATPGDTALAVPYLSDRALIESARAVTICREAMHEREPDVSFDS